MKRWEFLVLDQPQTAGQWIPDQYGAEGWELVSAYPASKTIDRLWFKRPAKVRRTPRDPSGSAKR